MKQQQVRSSDISVNTISCGQNEPRGLQVNTGYSSISVCPNRPSYSTAAPSSSTSYMPATSMDNNYTDSVSNGDYNLHPQNSKLALATNTVPVPSSTLASIRNDMSRWPQELQHNLQQMMYNKSPWKQMKYNIPEMPSLHFTSPYDYIPKAADNVNSSSSYNTSYNTGKLSSFYNNLYQKVKQLFGGYMTKRTPTESKLGGSSRYSGASPSADILSKKTETIWSKMAPCLRSNGVSEQNIISINKWYRNTMRSIIVDISRGAMKDTKTIENDLKQSLSALSDEIGTDAWTSLMLGDILFDCFLTAVVTTIYEDNTNVMPVPTPMPLPPPMPVPIPKPTPVIDYPPQPTPMAGSSSYYRR